MVPEKKISDWGVNRRFRFDYYLPKINIAIEINGGSWMGGRHTFGKGYETDLMKLNLAQQLGIKVYQFTYDMLSRGELKLFL